MSHPTKAQLLKAAKEVFVALAYEGATAQMIANAVGANIAAINYHLGSKADEPWLATFRMLTLADHRQVQIRPTR